MTQTMNRNPATTAVIQYDRHSYVPGGIVHPSPWSPRTDQQSPDINPPTDEFVSLASFFVHEADEADPLLNTVWAEAARMRAEAVTEPVIDLAAVMPQPSKVPPPRYRDDPNDPEMARTAKTLFGRGTHRPKPRVDMSPGAWMLAGAGLLVLFVAAVAAASVVAIRVSGAVL